MCKVNTLNLSNFHISPFRSPPLPDTAPPPSWGGPGAAGTRQILKQTSRQSIQSNGKRKYSILSSNIISRRSSFDGIIVMFSESAGPLYANIGSSDHQDGRHMSNRSNTLPSHRSVVHWCSWCTSGIFIWKQLSALLFVQHINFHNDSFFKFRILFCNEC